MSEPVTDFTPTPDESAHFSYQQDALLTRLRRIEGQVRGVQRMVEDGRYCLDIVTQIQAITAAAEKVSQQVLEEHIRGCVSDAIRDQRGDEAISELMVVLGKAMRR
ncbi:MAG TPA: metal-sensitive transcriptional regulator [Nitrolancea sp.]|jgi:DNA-binding FrmR family transcriptional regulator|nr:metal-sensitive transcriptional regulator [Nitrolancea sp.]